MSKTPDPFMHRGSGGRQRHLSPVESSSISHTGEGPKATRVGTPRGEPEDSPAPARVDPPTRADGACVGGPPSVVEQFAALPETLQGQLLHLVDVLRGADPLEFERLGMIFDVIARHVQVAEWPATRKYVKVCRTLAFVVRRDRERGGLGG